MLVSILPGNRFVRLQNFSRAGMAFKLPGCILERDRILQISIPGPEVSSQDWDD
jgi:hypothetical protein